MATAATPVDIGKLITISPKVWHGRPVVTGTRVTVMGVVGLHKGGSNPEEIAQRKYLTLAQVHAARAYYYANQQQVDDDIAEEQNEYDREAEEAVRVEKRA